MVVACNESTMTIEMDGLSMALMTTRTTSAWWCLVGCRGSAIVDDVEQSCDLFYDTRCLAPLPVRATRPKTRLFLVATIGSALVFSEKVANGRIVLIGTFPREPVCVRKWWLISPKETNQGNRRNNQRRREAPFVWWNYWWKSTIVMGFWCTTTYSLDRLCRWMGDDVSVIQKNQLPPHQ